MKKLIILLIFLSILGCKKRQAFTPEECEKMKKAEIFFPKECEKYYQFTPSPKKFKHRIGHPCRSQQCERDLKDFK
jgi:hypothetical protein